MITCSLVMRGSTLHEYSMVTLEARFKTQRTQYTLIKEYTVNYKGLHIII